MLLDQVPHLLSHDFLYQRGQILEMVIEGVAVDAAVLHDVFHSDLVQWPLVKQLQECFLNGCPGKIRHDAPPANLLILRLQGGRGKVKCIFSKTAFVRFPDNIFM